MVGTDSTRSLAKIHADLDRFGWHAVLVNGGSAAPPFAYTIGLQRTHHHPEILVFGLNVDLRFMHGILTVLVDAVHKGQRFVAGGEYPNILNGYRCTFVDIPALAYGRYLGTAVRFFGGDWFNAIQCIWPDREQRYPWEAGVHAPILARQPVLAQRDGGVWRFGALPKDRWVVTTRPVALGQLPVRDVVHDGESGDWQFLCGTTNDEEEGLVVCIGALVDRDATLIDVADLPPGWHAWREALGSPWRRERA